MDFPHTMQDKFQVIFLRSPEDEHPQVRKKILAFSMKYFKAKELK